MPYPVAYRRNAPVRNPQPRGFQPGRIERWRMGFPANDPRPAMGGSGMKIIPDEYRTIFDNLFSHLMPFTRVREEAVKMRDMLEDWWHDEREDAIRKELIEENMEKLDFSKWRTPVTGDYLIPVQKTPRFGLGVEFTQCPTPLSAPCVPPTHYAYNLFDNTCNFFGQTPGQCAEGTGAGRGPLPITVNAAKYVFYSFKSGTVWYTHSQWVRASGSSMPQAVNKPNFIPIKDWDEAGVGKPIYTGNPFIDPMHLPINQPVPDYEPLPFSEVPYRRPDEWRSPVEQTWRGPYPWLDPTRRKPDPLPKKPPVPRPVPPDTDPLPGPEPVGDPAPRPKPDPVQPNPKPWPQPGVSVGVDGWRSIPPKWEPPRRAPKFVKERKVVIAVGGVIGFLANHVSEYKDFIEAFYKAIPKELRKRSGKRKPTLQEMLNSIYANFEDIDLPLALKEVIENEIKDRLYGRAGQYAKAGKRAAAAVGVDPGAAGYQLGGSYRPQHGRSDAADYDIGKYLPKYSVRDAYRAVGWR